MGVGSAIACAIGASAVGLTALSAPFVSPAFRRVCLPYVPASDAQVANIIRLLKRCPAPVEPLIDLGSGDGRVVIECAKLGYSSAGVELNYPLVIYSKFTARRNGLSSTQAAFYRRNIFKTDLAFYNVCILFAAESIVEVLLQKIEEMRPNTHLIMCRFHIPPSAKTCWTLVDKEGEGIDTAWLYNKNS